MSQDLSSTSACSPAPLERVSDDFLKHKDNYRLIIGLIMKVATNAQFPATHYKVLPLYRFERYTYVWSDLFSRGENMEPLIEAFRKVGIRSDEKDPRKKQFRVGLNVPIVILGVYGLSQHIVDEARRLSQSYHNVPRQSLPPSGTTPAPKDVPPASTSKSPGVIVNPPTASGSSSKDLVADLVKEHSLKGAGYPGRLPTGCFAAVVIDAGKIELARKTFTAAKLKWTEAHPKDNANLNIIFRFFEDVLPSRSEPKGGTTDDGGNLLSVNRSSLAIEAKASAEVSGNPNELIPQPEFADYSAQPSNAVSEMQVLISEIRRLGDVWSRHLSFPPAPRLSAIIVRLIEAKGYIVVPRKTPFAAVANGEAGSIVPNQVPRQDLIDDLALSLEIELSRQ